MNKKNNGNATIEPKVNLLVEVVKDKQKLRNMRKEQQKLDTEVKEKYEGNSK